jgi:phenylacetate-CoA ligase
MFSMFEACAILRQHRWHNRNFLGKLAGIHHQSNLDKKFTEGRIHTSWGWPVTEVYPTGPANLLEVYTPVDEQAHWLRCENPDYLLTLPSSLQLLLEYCASHDIRFPNLKNVSTYMEVVSPELRSSCQEVLGVPIIDNYSCREVGLIASQCPDGDHYHINSENLIVEILDEEDRPCNPGESGRVVVTSLRNFAMPLIRYELNDHAEVGEPCPCGRGLPVLNQVMGRVRNMIKLPDGEKRWARMNRPKIRKAVPAVKQFQFVQTALDTIEVRLVTSGPLTSDDEKKLTAVFREKLPYPFRIVYRYLDEIPRKGGKIEDFLCEV